jgi:hypothetical protein
MAHLQTDGAQVFSLWHNGGMTGYHGRKCAKHLRAKLTIDIASGTKAIATVLAIIADAFPEPAPQSRCPARKSDE